MGAAYAGDEPGILVRLLRWLLLIISAVILIYFVVLPLDWKHQLFVSIALMLAAFVLSHYSKGQAASLAFAIISLFSSSRYIYYRFTKTFGFGAESGSQPQTLDMIFMIILRCAELYAYSILVLGFFQTIRPLERKPIPLPGDPQQWPSVDLFIPSYNEPLSVVRYTALAAAAIDYPPEKCHIYILDDGRREEFRQFAREAGIGYVTRNDNKGAKAGNINVALKSLRSTLRRVFDCDHVPTRSFLQVTMGWFLRRANLGMLQTPHHFYSPDPFERNLGQFRVIPNEGELFYGIVQDGNDFWNAAFFCGSCAVLRRTSLDEIGGIATDTVTEDAHTSLRMQMRGWNTAYINIPQAAGLATERLSRPREAAHSLGARHDSSPPGGQSVARAGPQDVAAALLLQRHAALPVRPAATDLPDRAADLHAAESHQYSWILGRHSGLCVASPGAVQRDQLAYSGPTQALVLERDLRDRTGPVHHAADVPGID
jgi:cellulose synthase (UDP-forming)